jgi:epsilon-lactone hydrolase
MDMNAKLTRRTQHRFRILFAFAAVPCLLANAPRSTAAEPATPSTELNLPPMAPPATISDDGVVTAPSFPLPFSHFASPQARDAFVRYARMAAASPAQPGPMDMLSIRRMMDKLMFVPGAEKMKKLYPYTSEKVIMNGVPVEIFTPAVGIAPENRQRVLINLHGGGSFMGGGGPGGVIESAPIAHWGRIKVVSVDYRMAPEQTFPASSEDVAAAYRELLKTYRPENIGIYGCSSGGYLSAQMVAWFQHVNLPEPGAIGVFCSSLLPENQGDSAYLSPRLGGRLPTLPREHPSEKLEGPYLTNVDRNNPLAVPSASENVLRAFPPTLFLTGTRAPEMSAAAYSHLRLRELGVKSEILIFDGLDHGFYNDPDLPESQQADKMIVQFFAENLGHRAQKTPRTAIKVPSGSEKRTVHQT